MHTLARCICLLAIICAPMSASAQTTRPTSVRSGATVNPPSPPTSKPPAKPSALVVVAAQTTVFTYQGRLTDAGAPASGTYQMQFALFDAATGGNQIGSTMTFDGAGSNPPAVSVANGVFTVQLDFGAAAFPGADRFLEIGVKKSAEAEYTTLAPRQQITSTPYAIQSLNAYSANSLSAACAGCVTDAHINAVDGAKVTGSVASATTATNATQLGGVAADQYLTKTNADSSFIRNATTEQAADFNVSGNGTLGGTLTSSQVAVNGGVLARGGVPGPFGSLSNDNGYAFSGNGAFPDSGLFSSAYGQVSVFTASAERLRVNRFGNVAIGAVEPTAKLDVRGDIKFGANGNYFATAGNEASYMIAGSYDGTTIKAGSGFIVRSFFPGNYEITFPPGTFRGFDSQASNIPVVTATCSSGSGSYIFAQVIAKSLGTDGSFFMAIRTTDLLSKNDVNSSFDFIVVGKRP